MGKGSVMPCSTLHIIPFFIVSLFFLPEASLGHFTSVPRLENVIYAQKLIQNGLIYRLGERGVCKQQ